MYSNRKEKVFLYNYFFRSISYILYRISYNFRSRRFGIIPRSQPSNNVCTYIRTRVHYWFFSSKYSIINVTRIRVSIEIVIAWRGSQHESRPNDRSNKTLKKNGYEIIRSTPRGKQPVFSLFVKRDLIFHVCHRVSFANSFCQKPP